MKKTFSLVLILLLVAIAVWMFIDTKRQSTAEGVEVPVTVVTQGELAPAIDLMTTTGEPFSLQALRGKHVVLNFWASWCPPCRKEMPAMQRYYDEYAKKHNVEVVAVNLKAREQSDERLHTFIEQYQLTLPMPLDVDGDVEERYRILTIPTTFIIDAQGRVQHEIQGAMNEQMLIEYVQNLQ